MGVAAVAAVETALLMAAAVAAEALPVVVAVAAAPSRAEWAPAQVEAGVVARVVGVDTISLESLGTCRLLIDHKTSGLANRG